MRPADIRCRLCGKRYDDLVGCATCEPAKRNLIWPKKDLPVLESIAAELIAVIERELATVRKEQEESVTKRIDYDRVKAVNQLSSSMSKILGEARQLEKQSQADIRNLSLEGKMKIFIDFYENELPEDARKKLVRTLQDREAALDASDADEALLLRE